MANKILSIEIGSRITNVIETDFKVKNPKIYKSFSFETPEEMFREGTAGNSIFKERLYKGLKENKIKTRRALFVLASSRIASRDVVIPLVKENQILSLLYANSAEYFPVDLQQYQLVYRILGEVTEEGQKKHKLMVLAVPHDMISTYRELATDCELILEELDYVGNAAIQILKEKMPQKLYAAVKIEDDTTLITILRDGEIQLQRNFSYGIEEAVGVIQRSGVLGEDSGFMTALRTLRQESFCSKKDEDDKVRDLAEDLEESFRAIIGNVVRVINFYSSNNAGAEMEQVVLYGMGAYVRDLENALKEEMNYPITSEPLRRMIVQEKSDLNKEFLPLLYAACAGSVVNPLDFRLEEEEKKKKKEQRKKGKGIGAGKLNISLTAKGFFKICVAVSVVLLLAVIPYYVFLRIGVGSLQKEKADKQYLEELYAEYESSQKECDDISSLYKSTETVSEGVGAFIQEMEEKMPSSISITSFTSNEEGVILDFSVNTKREAAKAVEQISNFESISDVQVQSLEEVQDELGGSSVQCMISGTYVGGSSENGGEGETTMEEDIDALENNQSEQSGSDGITEK